MFRNIHELARDCILAAETEDKLTLTRAAVQAWNDATALPGDCDPRYRLSCRVCQPLV
jgi:hypothetical protein